MSFRTIRRSTLLAAVLLASITGVAAAQAIPTSFEQLSGLVKAGDEVTVTDGSGASVKGRILDLSPAALKLAVNGGGLEFSMADVRAIVQQRHLSYKKSAAWGFIIGAGLGSLAAVPASECRNCGGVSVAAGLMFGGIGAGIGAGVAAATSTTRVVFVNAASTRKVTLAPIVDRDRHGVQLSLRF